MTPEEWFEKLKLISIKGVEQNSESNLRSNSLPKVAKVTRSLEYDPDFDKFFDSGEDIKGKIDKILDSMEVIGAECPKCKKFTFIRIMRQTRGGDEGESCISQCDNQECGHKEFIA